MAAFVTNADVRNALGVSKTDGLYADGIIGSNVRAASDFLQVRTGRQFEPQTGVTKYFTTYGRAAIRIPDLRSASAVAIDNVAQTVTTDYWLEPDYHNRGVYVGIQFRRFDVMWHYRSDPLWWDKNLDSFPWRAYNTTPQNLGITGNWGWVPLPDELIHAVTILAAWFTKRPEAVLSDVVLTPEGGFQRFSEFPPEVQAFVEAWRLTDMAVAT